MSACRDTTTRQGARRSNVLGSGAVRKWQQGCHAADCQNSRIYGATRNEKQIEIADLTHRVGKRYNRRSRWRQHQRDLLGRSCCCPSVSNSARHAGTGSSFDRSRPRSGGLWPQAPAAAANFVWPAKAARSNDPSRAGRRRCPRGQAPPPRHETRARGRTNTRTRRASAAVARPRDTRDVARGEVSVRRAAEPARVPVPLAIVRHAGQNRCRQRVHPRCRRGKAAPGG